MLDQFQKKKLNLVLSLVFISAIFEALGLLVIYPFILSVSAPNEFREISKLLDEYHLKFVANHILFCTVSLIILSNLIRFLANFAMNNFIQSLRPYFGGTILKKLFQKEYAKLLKIDRSSIQADVISEVDLLLATYFMPLLALTASISAMSMITASLLVLDWKLTLIIFAFFGCIFFILNFITSHYLMLIGGKRAKANDQRLKWLLIILDSMKIIRYENVDSYFIKNFNDASLKSSNLIAQNYNISQSPRYIIEGISLSLFVLGIWYVNVSSKQQGTSIDIDYALLGSLVYGGYRLLPHSNSIFQNISQLKFSKASIDRIKPYMNAREEIVTKIINKHETESIILKNVSFEHEPRLPIIKNFSFEFEKGKSYAIVGRSGSGKSTLVDLLLGLRQPSSGTISYPKTFDSIREMISYAPQSVVIHEGTLFANLTLGRDHVTMENIERAINISELTELFPSKKKLHDVNIIDQGRNFSGGQLQRISLCRSLCLPRNFIIFDEITSSLDKSTEEKIIENILKTHKSSTLIFVTHSPQVAQKMDHIIDLEDV
jgi:ATP-binding cassette, subfamily B, bacterial PglK